MNPADDDLEYETVQAAIMIIALFRTLPLLVNNNLIFSNGFITLKNAIEKNNKSILVKTLLYYDNIIQNISNSTSVFQTNSCSI